jgi:hypothetical protein
LESIPGPHKHLKIWAQEGTGGGGGGDDLPPQISGADVNHMCPKESRNHTILADLGGWAGCVYSSKSIERSCTILENYSAKSSSSFCEI